MILARKWFHFPGPRSRLSDFAFTRTRQTDRHPLPLFTSLSCPDAADDPVTPVYFPSAPQPVSANPSGSTQLYSWSVWRSILPQENCQGSYILAWHQSSFDAYAFLPDIPTRLILKRELTWIPLFGWYVMKMRMIAIDRGSRSKALKQAVEQARERMAEGRQLIIYPEGTRRPPGAEPAYKYGIVELYQRLQVPVVPVAHVAGLYWPRRKFMRYPGTIRARYLKPIPPGLDKAAFREADRGDGSAHQLLLEAADSPNPPPLPPAQCAGWDCAAQASSSESVPPRFPATDRESRARADGTVARTYGIGSERRPSREYRDRLSIAMPAIADASVGDIGQPERAVPADLLVAFQTRTCCSRR